MSDFERLFGRASPVSASAAGRVNLMREDPIEDAQDDGIGEDLPIGKGGGPGQSK